jgi:mannose-1-phosphate guanylyltransferase/mannose-6-phosphate isomerase
VAHRLLNPDPLKKANDTTEVAHLGRRAEHWLVVSGSARVTRGEETLSLEENQSTFIPIGMKHRLQNPASAPLFLVEVQSGDYLGEDDIERFEDRYNRS